MLHAWEEKMNVFRGLVGNLQEGDHLEDLDVDGRIILKWILKKCDMRVYWIDVAEDMGCCAHGTEPSGCIKCG